MVRHWRRAASSDDSNGARRCMGQLLRRCMGHVGRCDARRATGAACPHPERRTPPIDAHPTPAATHDALQLYRGIGLETRSHRQKLVDYADRGLVT